MGGFKNEIGAPFDAGQYSLGGDQVKLLPELSDMQKTWSSERRQQSDDTSQWLLANNPFPIKESPKQATTDPGKELIRTVCKSFDCSEDAEKASQLLAQSDSHIDFDAIAKRSFPQKLWDNLSPKQCHDLAYALGNAIEKELQQKLPMYFKKRHLDFSPVPESHDHGELVIKSQVFGGAKIHNVDWYLTSSGDHLKISRIIINEDGKQKDLLDLGKNRVDQLLKRGGKSEQKITDAKELANAQYARLIKVLQPH